MANLIIGCGYLGRRVARAWVEQGAEVFAVTRSTAKASQLADEGIHPILGDVASGTIDRLPPCETVLHSLGFDRSGNQSIIDVYVDGLTQVLERLDPAALRRFIYISSTGVFSQRGGEWVNESSECRPIRPGGVASLAAERALRAHPLGDRATVLRLAGIYGPDRIPRRRELTEGNTLKVPTQGHLNLIHVSDAVRVVLAVETSAAETELLLVSDGNPVLRIDYYRELARQLGVPDPQFGEPDADDPAVQRAAGGDKRICSDQLRHLLGLEMLYPTYREGLAAIIQSERESA